MNNSEVRDFVPSDMADATADSSDQALDGIDVTDDSAADGAASTDDQISELQRELTSERDKHLRLAAEFDNFRRRNLKEKMDAEARGQAELARLILDPLDDIARFAHVDPAQTDSKTIVEGVEMVEKKLDKALRGVGLEPVNPVDQKFDPALHEAVGTETADSHDLDGTVSRVYQPGYTFKGQLLRPARVVVRQHHD
ncbi:MAG: nucleotide exchange factor GrpE [Gemmatimonadales bacterium]